MYEEELEVAIKVRNLWLFSPSVSSLNCRIANNNSLFGGDAKRLVALLRIFITSSFIRRCDDKTARGQGGSRSDYFVCDLYIV